MTKEADDFSDAGLKPFNPNKSGEPLKPDASGSSPETSPQSFTLDDFKESEEDPEEVVEKDPLKTAKAKEEGDKEIENRSAKIQELSEQLYAVALQTAKTDPAYLDRMLQGDKDDRKLAKKLLERNKDLFGASSVEEYQVLKAKKQAGDDPAAQALAEIRARQEQLEHSQSESSWKTWKQENSVSGEAEKLADALHEEHPALAWGLVMDAVKGRLGGKQEFSQKASGSVAVGGANPPESEEVNMNSPLARRFLKGVNVKELRKFAKSYYSQ